MPTSAASCLTGVVVALVASASLGVSTVVAPVLVLVAVSAPRSVSSARSSSSAWRV
jgi:hypothetical protein